MATTPESQREPARRRRAEQSAIDEAMYESFPASDAPTWSATHAGAPSVARVRREAPDDVRARAAADLRVLAAEIGERNDQSVRGRRGISRATEFIASSLLDAGHSVTRVPVPGASLAPLENLEVVLPAASTARGDVVVGAHYDTVVDSPGGDDDASGVVVLLALARRLAHRRFARRVRLVAFANEEPPHARTRTMGSLVYATRLVRQGVHVEAMIALECVGLPGALALVGNLASRHVVRDAAEAFRTGTRLPVHSLALPGFLPLVKSSDHASFWRQGFRAAMLTDGGPLRSRAYHTARDVAAAVDPDQLVEVAAGTAAMIAALAGDAGRGPV